MIAGEAIVIFPEGARTPDGQLQPAEPGVGLLAQQAGVPIIPVHVDGTFRAMPRGRALPRPCRITVTWGEAKTAEEWLERADPAAKPARALAEIVLTEIARLGGQASPHPDNSPSAARPDGEDRHAEEK
jgi:1-acyl-sn-glycerol-3-phosphate acyltransferase